MCRNSDKLPFITYSIFDIEMSILYVPLEQINNTYFRRVSNSDSIDSIFNLIWPYFGPICLYLARFGPYLVLFWGPPM